MFRTDILDINTDEVFNRVLELKDHWISRSEYFGFWTLGRCAYLDGKTPAYSREIAVLNPILRQNFGKLYNTVIYHLSNHFGESVVLNDNFAYPSFHIFESNTILLTQSGLWHQDYPHITLGLTASDAYSFTLAVKLPSGGAGLDYKDIDGQERYLPYVEKGLVGHDGSILHRISSLKTYVPGEFRVTLQGHVVRINRQLTLFW
jgi:hypothetical protein